MTKTFTAPKVWKRPYTSIYSDNYRFGNSLYSGAVADIETRSKNYTPTYYSAPTTTASIIQDAGVRRAILEAEIKGASDLMPDEMLTRAAEVHKSCATQEANLKSSLASSSSHVTSSSSMSSSALTSSRSLMESSSINTHGNRNPGACFSTYAAARQLADIESELDDSRARRRRLASIRNSRPETICYSTSSVVYPTEGQEAANATQKDWSLERYYAKAVRNAHRVAFPM